MCLCVCSTHARALTQKHTHNTDGDDVNDSALKPSQIEFDRSLSSLCVCVVRARVCVCRTRSFSLSLFSLCASTRCAATAAEASIPTPFTAGSQVPTSCARAGSRPTLSLSLSLSQTRSAPAAEAAGNQTNTARAANHHVFEASAAQNNTAMLTHALHINTPHSLAAVHIHTLRTSTTFKVVSHYVQLGYKADQTGTQLTWFITRPTRPCRAQSISTSSSCG